MTLASAHITQCTPVLLPRNSVFIPGLQSSIWPIRSLPKIRRLGTRDQAGRPSTPPIATLEFGFFNPRTLSAPDFLRRDLVRLIAYAYPQDFQGISISSTQAGADPQLKGQDVAKIQMYGIEEPIALSGNYALIRTTRQNVVLQRVSWSDQDRDHPSESPAFIGHFRRHEGSSVYLDMMSR